MKSLIKTLKIAVAALEAAVDDKDRAAASRWLSRIGETLNRMVHLLNSGGLDK